MLRTFILVSLIAATGVTAVAQDGGKVANYSIGSYGSPSYEHFSFWVTDGKLEVSYSTKDRDKELPLSYEGVQDCKGVPCFKLSFSNGNALFAQLKGNTLYVSDNKGTYSKTFKWEYEGPVDGRGTFCQPCAADPKEAAALLKKHYLTKH